MTVHRELLRPRRWYNPISVVGSFIQRPRLYIAIALGIATLLALPADIPRTVRLTISWNVAAIFYLIAVFRLMQACNSQVVRKRAARHDESRIVILAVVLLAIASSLGAIAGIINEAKNADIETKYLYLGLAAATIMLSWTLTQIMFTLHYAHDYYRPDPKSAEAARGLNFPEDDHPDYWDFFYFATSIGAASQTSDTLIKSKALRRLVTLHAIVSFFFNTSVLALAINIAAGLI
jgi:uncharacterized membrane protein